MEGGCFLETWLLPHPPGDSSLKNQYYRSFPGPGSVCHHTARCGTARGTSCLLPGFSEPFYFKSVNCSFLFSMLRVGLDIFRDRLTDHFVCQSSGCGWGRAQPGALCEAVCRCGPGERVGRGGAATQVAAHSPQQMPPPAPKRFRRRPWGHTSQDTRRTWDFSRLCLMSYPEHPGEHGLLQGALCLGCRSQSLHGP